MTPTGRRPGWNQTRVARPFWAPPALGRHASKACTRAATPCRDDGGRSRSARLRGPPSEAPLCRGVGQRVAWPGLPPGQPGRLHRPRHAALAVDDAEALLSQAAEVDDPPSRDAVALRVGATQDQRL